MTNKDYLPIQKCIRGTNINTLGENELLAIIIGSGSRGQNVMKLAAAILNTFNGLHGLNNCGLRELSKLKGIGLTKAIKILASLELGKRIIQSNKLDTNLNSPQKVWNFLIPEIAGLKKEVIIVLVLNTKNMLIKKTTISIGTVNNTICHPREIFLEAIRESGTSIIIAHNHPSGSTTPSNEDIDFTKRILSASKIIGIKLADHIIISEKNFFSFKDAGIV